MNVLRQICSALLVSVAFCVAAGQEPQTVRLPVGSAVIAEFKGEVALHSPQGDALTLNIGTILPPDTVIQTMKRSSILLNLQDNSQVLIKESTNLILKSPAQGRGDYLQLLIGKILAKIQKRLGNAPAFRMGTPTAVITVRGTRFSVEVNKKQKTFVEVFEGVVEVAGFAQGTSAVMIRPGFHTGVDRDRAPEQPRELFGGDDRNSLSRRDDDRSGSSNRGEGGESSDRSGRDSHQGDRDHD
jgi:hypothetical protein